MVKNEIKKDDEKTLVITANVADVKNHSKEVVDFWNQVSQFLDKIGSKKTEIKISSFLTEGTQFYEVV